AYSVASIKERSPEVHLFIEMPRDAVDVNVHPTKAEVRFRDQSYIHQVIRRALGDALGRGPAPELSLESMRVGDAVATNLPLPHALGGFYPSRWIPDAPAKAAPYDRTGAYDLTPDAPTGVSPIAPTSDGTAAPTLRPMMALGQFRDTFIIAVDDEGI